MRPQPRRGPLPGPASAEPRRESASRVIQWTAILAAFSAACFAVSFTVLGLVRSDLDPQRSFVSEYAVGPFGPVMAASFLLHGLGILVLAVGLRHASVATPSRHAATLLLLLSSLSVTVLAFFPTDLPGQRPTFTGQIHKAVALVAFLAANAAFLLYAHSFRHDPHWSRYQKAATVLAGLSVAALAWYSFLVIATLASTQASAKPWLGAGERLAILANLLWVFVTAVLLRTKPIHPRGRESATPAPPSVSPSTSRRPRNKPTEMKTP